MAYFGGRERAVPYMDLVKTGYKVVGKHQGKLLSAIMGTVAYGEWWSSPEPGYGPLAVFSSIFFRKTIYESRISV